MTNALVRRPAVATRKARRCNRWRSNSASSRRRPPAAISAALPLLLGALGRNTSQPQGAEALFGALQKDHAGARHRQTCSAAVLGGGRPGQARSLATSSAAAQPRANKALGEVDRIGRRQRRHAVEDAGADRAGLPGQAHVRQRQSVPLPVTAHVRRRRCSATSSARSTSASASKAVLGGGLLGAVLDRDGDGDVGSRRPAARSAADRSLGARRPRS